MKWVIAIAVVAGLGAVAATIWVGSSVKEPTVVEHPYEEGLAHDHQVKERARLGWQLGLPTRQVGIGKSVMEFTLVDKEGKNVDADVKLTLGRPGSGREDRRMVVRKLSAGVYMAEFDVPAGGTWEALFEATRGADRLRLEERLVAAECDAAQVLCQKPLPGGGTIWFEIGPRPLRTMQDAEFTVHLSDGDGPLPGANVTVRFEMPGMTMAPNVTGTAGASRGRYVGETVLVKCASGRKDWVADVEVHLGGRTEHVKFPFQVAE